MQMRSTLRAAAAASAVGLLALCASPAMARPGHRGGHGPFALEHRIEKLDLDSHTAGAVREILEAAREEGRATWLRLHEARRQMRALLEQPAPDADAVFAQAEAIGALQTQARKQHLKTLLDVQSLLTPEQREQLREQRPGPRPGHHGGHGGCGDRAPY